MSEPKTILNITDPGIEVVVPDRMMPDGWVGIARDDRTGHYWYSVPGKSLPACGWCRRWMTDWTLVNRCEGMTHE